MNDIKLLAKNDNLYKTNTKLLIELDEKLYKFLKKNNDKIKYKEQFEYFYNKRKLCEQKHKALISLLQYINEEKGYINQQKYDREYINKEIDILTIYIEKMKELY
jgi:NADH:ubiquinone oxidoreductase subunit E